MNTNTQYITLKDLCEKISITVDTGKNWLKLGKIECQYKDGKDAYFTERYVSDIEEKLKTGELKFLRSRRNKKYTSGNKLYSQYVSEESENIDAVRKLLKLIDIKGIELTEETLTYILAECAIQLMILSYKNDQDDDSYTTHSKLKEYLTGNLSKNKEQYIYYELIDDLISDKVRAYEFIEKYPEIFEITYIYECREDILGLLYISCKNMGSRKQKGAYYTPKSVVQELIENLWADTGKNFSKENNKEENKESNKDSSECQKTDNMTILDPCCGTGNFLLQLPEEIPLDNIYGSDIDELAVKLTRINLALKYKPENVYELYSHIEVKDFLKKNGAEVNDDRVYDYIIGNPPWGSEFTEDECGYLQENYEVAVGKTIEAYDVFVEKALSMLKKDGIVSFVLPEAILKVKAHMAVRELIAKKCNIEYLSYLGEVFYGVQCPSVILKLCKKELPMSTQGMIIREREKEYVVNIEREVCKEHFNFKMTDEEYETLRKMKTAPNMAYLKGNAKFALGIVTGDNKKHISNHKDKNNEPVLTGKDIEKYIINEGDSFIEYKSNGFQQMAPIEHYRAKEKLVYRFIGGKLIFAYDNKERLTLNSCNILIPEIEGLHIKYIMAVLNSDIVQFFYDKEFDSMKILRSHLEQIPIPIVSEEKQQEIVRMVDKLIAGGDKCGKYERVKLLTDMNNEMSSLYGI